MKTNPGPEALTRYEIEVDALVEVEALTRRPPPQAKGGTLTPLCFGLLWVAVFLVALAAGCPQ